jgi:gluconate kinase
MPSNRINMNPFPASQLVALESHMSFFQTEESMVLPHANVVPRMEAGSSLADDDVSWLHFLKNDANADVQEQFRSFSPFCSNNKNDKLLQEFRYGIRRDTQISEV